MDKKWAYSDLSPLFPNVGGWNKINHEGCGVCVQLTYTVNNNNNNSNSSNTTDNNNNTVSYNNQIFITLIDSTIPPPPDSRSSDHFTISTDAFIFLVEDSSIFYAFLTNYYQYIHFVLI